jgi:streptogramin lyase
MLHLDKNGRVFSVAALLILGACSMQRGSLGPDSFAPAVQRPSGPHNSGPVLKEYTIKTKKLAQIFQLTFDANRNLWFDSYTPYVGEMTPGGAISAHVLPRKTNPYGLESVDSLTLGPDHNIWFTDNVGKEIGTISPSGEIREYQPFRKTGYAFTDYIVAFQRHVWITMPFFNVAYLAEVNNKAKVAQAIPLPGYFCYPGPITVDKTGTFWIGNGANCPKITRVTPEGKVRDFPIVAADGIWAVAAGPDGNVWFTAADAPTINDYVAKITPTGEITKYPISNQVDSIALGPDGNWWMTMPFVGKIESMTMQGNIVAEYTLPHAINGSQPEFQACQIIQGPDGNMWFGEGKRNKIGELVFSRKMIRELSQAPY